MKHPPLRGVRRAAFTIIDKLSFSDRIRDLVEVLLPAYKREQKSYLVVAFGCTGGKHRSVYFADRLARDLSSKGWVVALVHRDRDREG